MTREEAFWEAYRRIRKEDPEFNPNATEKDLEERKIRNRETSRLWHREHRDHVKEYQQKWMIEHPDRRRKYYLKKKEKMQTASAQLRKGKNE
jgi:hypothetical protein